MMEKLKSHLYLAWCTFLHFLKKLTGRRKGLDKFKENYFSEGLVPLKSKEEKAVLQAMKCTNCGLCRENEVEWKEGGFLEPHYVLLAMLRDFSMYRMFKNVRLRGSVKEIFCPFGVDFEAVFSYLEGLNDF